jgi:hypothetical protein
MQEHSGQSQADAEDAEDAEAVAELASGLLDDILERVDTSLDRARAALRAAPKEDTAPLPAAGAAAPIAGASCPVLPILSLQTLAGWSACCACMCVEAQGLNESLPCRAAGRGQAV